VREAGGEGKERPPERLEGLDATVLVLGDVGRSPRIQYHALSLAREGARVELVGYPGSEPLPELAAHPRVRIVALREPPAVGVGWRRWWAVAARLLAQPVGLALALLARTRRPRLLLAQTPPAVPTLAVARLASRARGAQLWIDWHNFGFRVAALKLGAGHWGVRLAESWERALARGGDRHLCVSAAMGRALAEVLGVEDAVVLRDAPPERFEPLPEAERAGALADVLGAAGIAAPTGPTVVSPTSWTLDEDFDLLVDALLRRERRAAGVGAPQLTLLLTGRGPRRGAFETRLSELELRRTRVHTLWLAQSAYPRLLAAADIGLSLHRSASGVDLPMKVADMRGAGLPVWMLDYGPVVGEQLADGGVGFRDAVELEALLAELDAGPVGVAAARERAGRGVGDPPKRWHEAWCEVVLPALEGLA